MLKSEPRKWKQISAQMEGRADIQVRYRVRKIKDWLLEQGVPEEYFE